VNLLAQTDVQLDGTRESMEELDAVCVELLEDGPLEGERFDVWLQLIGGYTGEVVIRRPAASGSSTSRRPEPLQCARSEP
jgi:hypothetical protein